MLSITGYKYKVSPTLIGQVAIFVLAIAYSVLYLGLPDKWWYEDDPLILAYAREVSNPIDFFIDTDILRHVATGASAVPMWLLSFWIDSHVFPLSTTVAYLHNVTSFAIVALLLFTTFNHHTQDLRTSFLLVIIWLLLPSTVSVLSFLSARHYLEGLGWGLLACYYLPDLCNDSIHWQRKLALHVVTILGLCAAMMSKEIYVPTLLAIFFLYGTARKRYSIIIIAVSAALFYWYYRSLMVGTVNTYPVPLLGPAEYAKYLATIPYTLTLSHAGYLAYLVFAGCIAFIFIGDNHALKRSLGLVIPVFIAGVISVYPTAFAVLQTYRIPGTWYRSSFIISTLFIILFCWLLTKVVTPSTRMIILFLVAILVAPGNIAARAYWNERHLRSETEGMFYLDNPDKLLYSEEDAYWFIPGLETLYKIRKSHYIDKINTKSDHSKEMLAGYPTIWRYENGAYARSDALYNYIKSKNE